MSKNTAISLGEHFVAFIDDQVAKGRYGSATDVMRASLRLLEEREAKLDALRAALIAGEESGPPRPFDIDEFLAERHKERSPRKRKRAK